MNRIDVNEQFRHHDGGRVSWKLVERAVEAIGLHVVPRTGNEVGRASEFVALNPEEIIAAAQHLAGHYRAARKTVPDVLQVLL